MASFLSNFRQRVIAFILLGFFALLGIVGMSIWLGYVSQINFENALLARDMRAAASELRSGLQAAESSQRGFLITNNEIYLAPLGAAKASTLRQFEKLKSLMIIDSGMQPAMQKLNEIILEKLSESDKTIALKRLGDDKGALGIIASNAGKRLMDEANLFINSIIQKADTRLTASVTEERSSGLLLRFVSILSAFTIIAIAIAIWLMISRNTRDLTTMRDKVLEINTTLEQRVSLRTAKLGEANQEIQRFAYIVTHDLRSPLVNIMGFTSELERSLATLRPIAAREENVPAPSLDEVRLAVEEDMPEAIGFIRSSTRKMDVLIGAILQLARVGQRNLRPETISLDELIKEAMAAVQYQLTEVGGSIETELSVTHIFSDRIALAQIFGNLFDNAIKYRSPTRPVLIKVTSNAGTAEQIILQISDNGRGIAAHDKERIFEMFRRSGELNQQGEGIGLYYVRSLLGKLGGDIEVDSVLGSGTVFRIHLPTTLHVTESDAK